MRRSLNWALAAAVIASVAATWIAEVPNVVGAIDQRGHGDLPLAVSLPSYGERQPVPLPEHLPTIEVEAAKRDLFAPYLPSPLPANPISVTTTVDVRPVEALPLQSLQAPAVNLRFLGSMVTPAGQRLVYLARGEAVLSVALGDRLEEGYIVSELASDAVTLTFPSLNTRVVIPISEPPQQ